MTNSYGGNPFSASNQNGSKIDSIRILLRITSDPFELSDEEIQFIVDENPGNIYWQSFKCAQIILGNYRDYVNRSMGPLSLSNDQIYQHWLQLAENMRLMATTQKTSSPLFHSSDNGEKIFSIGYQNMNGYPDTNSGY